MEHTLEYHSRHRTALCSCTLWACYRTTLTRASGPFQEHVEKELLNPTDPSLIKKKYLC